MTCPLPPQQWWLDYVGGRLKTPSAIVQAAFSENPDKAKASERFFDIPDPGPTFDAPDRLKAPGHMKSQSYMSQIRRANWADCDTRLIVWAGYFQMMAAKRGIPLYAHSALRPKSVQDNLVNKGRSKARYPRSAHNIGEACDIVHGVYHWQMNDQEWKLLSVLGFLALDRLNNQLRKADKLSLTWGGSWSFYDPAHWEISDYRDRIRPRAEPPYHVSITPRQAVRHRASILSGHQQDSEA